MIGRPELLDHTWTQLTAGPGVLLYGTAGIGRTTLIEALTPPPGAPAPPPNSPNWPPAAPAVIASGAAVAPPDMDLDAVGRPAVSVTVDPEARFRP